MLALLMLATLAHASHGEVVPAGEPRAIRQVLELVEDAVRSQAREDGHATRDAHAKAHGCVKATFEVLPGLPPMIATGVFAEPKAWPAWIRFSNGSGRSQDDSVGDGRGMAIKLMGVANSPSGTQDFVMINHPTFFIRNAVDYVDFERQLLAGGNVLWFFFNSLNPFAWRTGELSVMRALIGKEISNPLEATYHSMTPYALGDEAVKFSAAPAMPAAGWPRKGPNFLGENLARKISAGGFEFDFRVQLRLDPASMPIEDPTVEWSERKSPQIRVARVTIPRQDITSAERREFCENLSMTPGHTLPEHRPLGGINRMRLAVYEKVSRLRHDLNGVQRVEPEPRSLTEQK